MKRYHVNCYVPPEFTEWLVLFTKNLNKINWKYTSHSIDRIKDRTEKYLIDTCNFIKAVTLRPEKIFEFYVNEANKIEKVCYRIAYKNGEDLIVVVNNVKAIITVYFNSADDKHFTLHKELYEKETA